ncbi:MAG: hypothetical protein PHT48_06190 [Dechloromonas sp.]|nr:hypothetical protein [Dechloromonas sp.]
MMLRSCQSGGSLLPALLLLSLLSLAYGNYRHVLAGGLNAETQAAHRLQQAAEALLARAANDDNRPGSLPCPDLLTNNSAMGNLPGDGKADLLTRNQCPTPLGLLPWATLALPIPHDPQGNTLWYMLAPGLTDDDSSQPLHGNTTTRLQFDADPEVAALLIAPGPPQSGQRRPTFDPAHYLEGQLSSTSNIHHYQQQTGSNDRILAISRQRLQHAVGQRVTQQVRRCLQAHGHNRGAYPWPAALGDATARGESHRLFGRLPLTQPSPGLADEISRAHQRLTTTRPPDPSKLGTNDQLAALDGIDDALSWHDQLFYNIRQSTQAMSDAARFAESNLASLWLGIEQAIANNRIARSEGSNLRSQGHNTLAALSSLLDAIDRLGFDAQSWSASAGEGPANTTENRSGQQLQAIHSSFSAALQSFEQQDGANPRPLQQALVPYAMALQTTTVDLPHNLEIIIQHALSANSQAIEGQQRVGTARLSLSNAQKIVPQPPPKSGTNTAAQQAWTGLNSDLDALQVANRQQLLLAHGSAAQAWPMSWATTHCRFLFPNTVSWWQANQWHDDIFYQISHPDSALTGSLHSDHHRDLALVVIAAGPPLLGQQRPSSALHDYLEGALANPSRQGPATTPETTLNACPEAAHNTHCNDLLAF